MCNAFDLLPYSTYVHAAIEMDEDLDDKLVSNTKEDDDYIDDVD